MIRNQWYVILESGEIRRGKALGVTRLGEKLVVWRGEDGKIVCMADLCPHLGAPLCLGKVNGERLACPFHGFEFDAAGACTYLPAYGRNGEIPRALQVKVYPTYEDHGLVWIYWGQPTQDLTPPEFFAEIGDDFSFRSFKQLWPVHYSRVIENQLDMAHLPFVHHDTIGRGNRVVIDGPLVLREESLMNLWVYNREDDGTPRRRMEEIQMPQRHPFLQFRFPNLWQNWISADLRIVVAFVPVDEENTLFYARYYQRMVRVPILRDLFNLIGVWSSIYIANQDRRIVSYQLPKKTSLKKMGEKIMPSDGGILEYRKYRQQLKENAGQED